MHCWRTWDSATLPPVGSMQAQLVVVWHSIESVLAYKHCNQHAAELVYIHCVVGSLDAIGLGYLHAVLHGLGLEVLAKR